MLGLIVVIVVFSIVILVHELGHFLVARRAGVRVERFSLGLGKVLFSKKIGETEYAISAIPFGGYIKMAGEEPSDKREGKPWEFYQKAPGRRFWILIAGAGLNYILAFMIFSFIVPVSRIGVVIKDMPAHKAGLEGGDKITSINGKVTRYWYQVLDILSADKKAKPFRFRIDRDGKSLEKIIKPDILESKDIFGRTRTHPKIGIGSYGDVELLKTSPLGYIKTGMRQTYYNTALTYKFIWYLVTGKVALKGSTAGPIGIAVILGKAVKIGIVYLIYLVAHINLALAIFNLLPFPILDGGHILFLGLEKLRRRPLSFKVQEMMQYAAITLIIAFFLLVSYNDIMIWILKK